MSKTSLPLVSLSATILSPQLVLPARLISTTGRPRRPQSSIRALGGVSEVTIIPATL